MYKTISANDLKTKGISMVAEEIAQYGEAVVTVRGKGKYVIIPIEKYNELREYELLAALAETRKAIADGDYTIETVEEHIKSITHD
ncbi:MAG TPA: type II toxin-antitoxin system prevent-host-death family antitoxin [Clostridiales bacterium]|nr:type II toxin-antitoxin system prevent-host-death family antitoxin [Clostridiales bacterium]HQP68990.1 type II toxin-antitoxin system prevent-host-death family antitoxin [Clostridiales bacterium]